MDRQSGLGASGVLLTKQAKMAMPEFASPRLAEGHSQFQDGLAWVETYSKWGYIDKAGTMVIPPQFDGAEGFSEGLARVQIGVEVTPPMGSSIVPVPWSLPPYLPGKGSVSVQGRGWPGWGCKAVMALWIKPGIWLFQPPLNLPKILLKAWPQFFWKGKEKVSLLTRQEIVTPLFDAALSSETDPR